MSHKTWSISHGPVLLYLGTCGCQTDDGVGASEPAASTSTESSEPATSAPDPTTGSTSSTTGTPTTGSTSSTTDGPGTTTSIEPYCGDGQLDPGEECDEGPLNSDDASCTHTCKQAVCGDGFVWTGVEACDFGGGNSSDYGGCDQCNWSSFCGDSVVDAGHEECDLGPLNGTGNGQDEGMSACSKTCNWKARLVFVTSTTYTGALGGLDGADIRCRDRAKAAGLAGAAMFRAWLSDATQSPTTRFQQVDLLDAPYALLSGKIVGASFAELVGDGPRTGLAVTETGEMVFEQLVWSNTSGLGNVLDPDNTCADWTSANAQYTAFTGLNALALEQGPDWDKWKSDRQWTVLLSWNCNQSLRLYCFEDGYEPEE